MKTVFFNIAALALTISGVFANPAPNRMAVDISERDGVLEVREVPRAEAGIQCRECVHLGGRCTIGDGSCYASEHASCRWCGNNCKSRCIGDGQTCEQWCL
ncbi:hypothetical protein NOF04DRAFT_18642 [Fusarium oxysporum II5]|nr:uncharacterized protein FOIG_04868 [Fusarium odoratissimum NRRL 54006]EXM04683.1 hypothetical protein FOIG_04868 [Fusarium odoratissimum NRRL 54006]KAK2126741.1 hypothetical protein NOF04DRAFT_18642 [Fusarium oxysporum II5]TXB98789.1 hypothetical protein FocTR4_00012581 [Fusarium oxysporum f. sp. cubense]